MRKTSILLLCLSACTRGASPGSRGSSSSAAASVPDSTPLVSPDNSVRKARPEEISAGRAPAPEECVGDACQSLAVTWLAPGYRFENRGSRPAHVLIWFLVDSNCARQAIEVDPGQTSGWGNAGFCKPYHASFEASPP